MFEAIIFDFDGVILESEPIHFAAIHQVLKEQGIELSKEEYWNTYLGLPDEQIFTQLFSNQEKAKRLTLQKNRLYHQAIKEAQTLPVIKGFHRFLHEITQEVNKIGLYSCAVRSEINVCLEKLSLDPMPFEIIITAEDVKKRKPYSDGYLLAAQKLEIAPTKCVVIEDSPTGIAAAKAAGMHVIALATTFKKDALLQADEIFNDFEDLLQKNHLNVWRGRSNLLF